jgi:putative metallohydrolase (TIGR04338 family)
VGSTAVYAAEDQWSAVLDRGGVVDFFGSRIDVPTQRRFGDLASVRGYVEAVLALPEVAAAHPLARAVTVRERAGQTKAHYEPGTRTIAVPLRTMWAAREAVLLHEITHHLMASDALAMSDGLPSGGRAREQPAWHGAEYRETMCGLVATVLGEPAALLLRAGYDAVGLPTAAGR